MSLVNKNNEPSTFTRYLLEGSSFELLYPKRPDKEIIKYLKKRLLEKRVTVACLHCRNWKTTLSVNNFEDNPKCPQCGARYVGILRRREYLEIVRKGAKGQIDEEEKKTLKEIKDSADLILPYGKKAIIVLAGIGIGPRTAKRILVKDRKMRKTFSKISLPPKEFTLGLRCSGNQTNNNFIRSSKALFVASPFLPPTIKTLFS